ncbi:uncharacterized protein LOC134782819 [Penaeus indicus]|uniref:uncharacterized protein LOC134782819 n=1 Tax=Penaeus indicus TaxID=29960 RepID=UPI00300C3C8B
MDSKSNLSLHMQICYRLPDYFARILEEHKWPVWHGPQAWLGLLLLLLLLSLLLLLLLRVEEEARQSCDSRVRVQAEGDLRSFSERREHFRSRDPASGQELFTQESRPPELVQLYRDATETPIHIMREIDQLRDDGIRSSRFFMCEPVLGDSLKKEKLRKLNLDIETRRLGTGARGKGRYASNMEWDAGEGSGVRFRSHGRMDVLF